MTILTEGPRPGECIIDEPENDRGRDIIVITASQTLLANQVIGRLASAATVGAAVANAGNTGNGAVTLADPAWSATVLPGTYRVTFIEPATNLGTFIVTGPDGIDVGRGVVGTAFTGPINFTIAGGSTDFVAGDGFTISVTAVSFHWGAYDPTATDGRAVPRGVLYDAVTTGSGATARAVGIVRAAQINAKKLQWLTGLTDGQKTAAIALLNAQPGGLTVRTL